MIEYTLECTFCTQIQQIVHVSKALNLTPCSRRQPDWWQQVAYTGTKLLYQQEPKQVVYIVLVRNILGRLLLAPYGEHGTMAWMLAVHTVHTITLLLSSVQPPVYGWTADIKNDYRNLRSFGGRC